MTPSDDLSPPRRPIFFPVVIATVFLTIIGMTAGFVLGEKRRNEDRVSAEQSPESSGPVEVPSSAPQPTFCPAETLATAARLKLPSELYQVMKIETDNGTMVWICTDSSGDFYYQSKTGGADAPLVEGDNALFLSGVENPSRDHFEVLDHRGNEFVITRKVFELHFSDGRKQTNPVVSSQ